MMRDLAVVYDFLSAKYPSNELSNLSTVVERRGKRTEIKEVGGMKRDYQTYRVLFCTLSEGPVACCLLFLQSD